MTLKDEFAALIERIAKARADLAAWKAAGMQEKYIETSSLVDALELQLEQLRQAGLSANEDTAAVVAAVPAAAPTTREALMDEFSISYNGRQYQYDRYRYDLLADAVDYAKLQRSTLSGGDGSDPDGPVQDQVETPDASERELMVSLDITLVDGTYHFGSYRYERLSDAVNYARLQRLQGTRATGAF
jgi:hypothetical protein